MKNKIEIIHNKPDVSAEELDQFMDFDQLLAEEKGLEGPAENRGKLPWFFTLLAGMILILGLGFYFSGSTSTVDKIAQESKDKSEVVASENLSKSSEQIEPKAATKTQIPPSTTLTQDKNSSNTNSEQNSKNQNNQKAIKLKTEITALPEKGYALIEAKPKDGMKALYRYFAAELKYPKALIPEKIEGEVLINFTINKAGKAEQLSIEKSLGASFDQEALRVIQNMPDWNPATINGTKIDSKLSIPLYFNFEE